MRRAQSLLVGIAVVMAAAAVIESVALHKRLLDPEGSFLGPSYLRLPILLGLALLVDLVPRMLWVSRLRPTVMPGIVRERLRTHWDRDRLVLVGLGVTCFYVVYVSYRNMKSLLPFAISAQYDRELHLLDRAIFFGHDPTTVLHTLLGTGIAAHVLSYVYLWFLPVVPVSVTAWLVFSRQVAHGYWFVCSQCMAWMLGTASYYALPTLGPGLQYAWLVSDLKPTNVPTFRLMDSLIYTRQFVSLAGLQGQVNSVAGFASLHAAITLLLALMVQYTFRSRLAKAAAWGNFVITVTATIYFGWHYLSDDLAGVAIGLVSFYVGGVVSGHRFDRRRPVAEPVVTGSEERPVVAVGRE